MSGKVTLRAKGDSRAARGFLRGAAAVKPTVLAEFETELGPRLLRVSRQAAPHGRGALERGLRFRLRGRAAGGAELRVESTVRSAEGFPYTGVTRFGHRSAFIYPKRKKALRTPWGPRRKVRGYHPVVDWGYVASIGAKEHVERSSRRIGRSIQVAIGS